MAARLRHPSHRRSNLRSHDREGQALTLKRLTQDLNSHTALNKDCPENFIDVSNDSSLSYTWAFVFSSKVKKEFLYFFKKKFLLAL